MVGSWILGILASLYIVFSNTGEIPVSQERIDELSSFGTGLLMQYNLLHFFNEQENGE